MTKLTKIGRLLFQHHIRFFACDDTSCIIQPKNESKARKMFEQNGYTIEYCHDLEDGTLYMEVNGVS